MIGLVSLDTLKEGYLKIAPLFAKHFGHDKLIHGNQHSQYPKKPKKQPETWTGIRQTRRRQKIQESKEIN